jgi:hypothetical protein
MSFLNEWRTEQAASPQTVAKVAILANDTGGSKAGKGFLKDQKKGDSWLFVANNPGSSQKIATSSQRVANVNPCKQNEIAKIATIATREGSGRNESTMPLNQRRWLPGHCRACGGTSYWINAGGARVCSVCHPPAHSRAFFIHSEQKTA